MAESRMEAGDSNRDGGGIAHLDQAHHQRDLYVWESRVGPQEAADEEFQLERPRRAERYEDLVQHPGLPHAALPELDLRGIGFGTLAAEALTVRLEAAQLVLSSVRRFGAPVSSSRHHQRQRSAEILMPGAPRSFIHGQQQQLAQRLWQPSTMFGGIGFGTLAVGDRMHHGSLAGSGSISPAATLEEGQQETGSSAANAALIGPLDYHPPAEVAINSSSLAPRNTRGGGARVVIPSQADHPSAAVSAAAATPGPSTTRMPDTRIIAWSESSRPGPDLPVSQVRDNGDLRTRVPPPPTSIVVTGRNGSSPSDATGVRLTIRITSEARRRAAVADPAANPAREPMSLPAAVRSVAPFPSGLMRPPPSRVEHGRAVGGQVCPPSSRVVNTGTSYTRANRRDTISITNNADGAGSRMVKISPRARRSAVVAASAADPPTMPLSASRAAAGSERDAAAFAVAAAAAAAKGSLTLAAPIAGGAVQADVAMAAGPAAVCFQLKQPFARTPHRASCAIPSPSSGRRSKAKPSAPLLRADEGGRIGAVDRGIPAQQHNLHGGREAAAGAGKPPKEEFLLPPYLAEEAGGALAAYAALKVASKRKGGKWLGDTEVTIPFQLEEAMAQLTCEAVDDEEGVESTPSEEEKKETTRALAAAEGEVAAAPAGAVAAAAVAAAERERAAGMIAEALPKVRAHVEPMELAIANGLLNDAEADVDSCTAKVLASAEEAVSDGSGGGDSGGSSEALMRSLRVDQKRARERSLAILFATDRMHGTEAYSRRGGAEGSFRSHFNAMTLKELDILRGLCVEEGFGGDKDDEDSTDEDSMEESFEEEDGYDDDDEEVDVGEEREGAWGEAIRSGATG